MTARTLVSSGSHMEPVVGFSRAVRVGDHVAIGGTAAIGPGGTCVGEGDAAAQAREILRIAEAALGEAGASLGDVTRTRIILTDIADWPAVAEVHAEAFAGIRPVTTIMGTTAFADPRWLVEIEFDAVVHDPG